MRSRSSSSARTHAGFAYQTLGLLVFAYVVRFLPQAVASSHSALLRVDPRLEEAARGLARARGAFATVTAPLVTPGLLAGAALVFLDDEGAPGHALLAPIGFDTLVTEVWTATTVAAYSEAALPALLLVVFSAPFVYVPHGPTRSASTPPVSTRPRRDSRASAAPSRYTGSRVRRPSRSSKWTWYVWYMLLAAFPSRE